MANSRPTRWRKAKSDWPGLERRDLVVGAGGLVLAVVILVLSNFSGTTVAEVAIVGGSAIGAALFYALAQLVWAWLQAPMRLLTEDVIAIRERVEATPIGTVSASPRVNVRATLLVQLRKGREIVDYTNVSPVYVEQWTDDATEFLGEHVSAVAAEQFLEVTTSTGREGMRDRLAYLEKLIVDLKDEA